LKLFLSKIKIVPGSGLDFLKLFSSIMKSYPAPGMIF
jgi:hypothetical protein